MSNIEKTSLIVSVQNEITHNNNNMQTQKETDLEASALGKSLLNEGAKQENSPDSFKEKTITVIDKSNNDQPITEQEAEISIVKEQSKTNTQALEDQQNLSNTPDILKTTPMLKLQLPEQQNLQQEPSISEIRPMLKLNPPITQTQPQESVTPTETQNQPQESVTPTETQNQPQETDTSNDTQNQNQELPKFSDNKANMNGTASSIFGAVSATFAAAYNSTSDFIHRQSNNAIGYYNDTASFLNEQYTKTAEKASEAIKGTRFESAHLTAQEFVKKHSSILNHLAVVAGAGIAANSAFTLLQGKTKQPKKEALKLVGAAGLLALVSYGTAKADQSSALKLTALISAVLVTASRITTAEQVSKQVFRLKTLYIIRP